MGKMVIFPKYIIWKIFLHHPFNRDVPNSYVSFPILQYHFTSPIIRLCYPYDLRILPYYSLKNGSTELISTIISLHIGPFQLHTRHFSIGSTSRIMRRKRPLHVIVSSTFVYGPVWTLLLKFRNFGSNHVLLNFSWRSKSALVIIYPRVAKTC
jgi:hypothetical protein